MPPSAFTGRLRNTLAALLSVAAVSAIVVYVAAPVAAAPSIHATSVPAKHPLITGIVKGDARKARVTLVFRDARGHMLAVRRPRVARDGRWRASIPAGARTVTVVVREGGRTMKLVETVTPGRSISVTAVFPSDRPGLLPGVFPY